MGSIEATRNAWGRNNFITFEIHGTEGSIFFNYENRDELQVAFKSDPADRRGFRTVYTGPNTPYGEALWPIPALGIGYGETKIIEREVGSSPPVTGGLTKSVPPFSITRCTYSGEWNTSMSRHILLRAPRAGPRA